MACNDSDVDDVGDKFDELNFRNISTDFKQFETLGSFLDVWESDDESDSETDTSSHNVENEKYMGTPFNELWAKFSPIEKDDVIRKMIIRKGNGVSTKAHPIVKVQFSGFWEGDKNPFEFDKNAVWDLNNDFLMPGILMAVESMEIGEYSIFLISHKVMYGEMGCPPRIRPKSTSLYHMRILGSMKENIKESTKDLSFEEVFKKVNELCTQGEGFYKKEMYSRAEGSFKPALHLLEKCPIADEGESKKSTNKMLYVYLYLTMCCIKMNQPKKACSMCNSMKRINMKAYQQNYKALFHNGIALMMIGNINEAKTKFIAAKCLKPDNKEINEQLTLIEEINKKKNNQADIMKVMSKTYIQNKHEE